ncbi:MAG: hypothetical protein ACFN40_01985, partial [Bacteroidota bacterium]
LRLRPENSHNINLGFFGALRPAAGHRLDYELNAFYRDVKDYIQSYYFLFSKLCLPRQSNSFYY